MMTQLHNPIRFTLPIPPVTKKNSPRIIWKGRRCPRCKKGEVPRLLPSERFLAYQDAAKEYIPEGIQKIDYPVNVKAVYYMPTRRKVDLTNLHEALHDMLVTHGVLDDDNSKIVVSTDGSRVLYDKENPRTEIWITESADVDFQITIL